MFIQADLGDGAASRGVGGTEYLGRADSCVDPEPPLEESAIDQVDVDPSDGYGAAFTFTLANERIRVPSFRGPRGRYRSVRWQCGCGMLYYDWLYDRQPRA